MDVPRGVRGSGVLSLKTLGKAGDATANQFLVHALREQRPDDAVLSEEEKDNLDRLSASRVWIVDPVDGTREYGEQRTDWAVHVALTVDGGWLAEKSFAAGEAAASAFLASNETRPDAATSPSE